MRLLLPIIILTITSCNLKSLSTRNLEIDLSGQHLKSIPDSVFKKRDLTHLDLGSSQVIFYPPLSGLVDTNANDISVVPEKIGELTKLKSLNLNSNKLTALPNALTKLSNLEVLDLSNNKELEVVSQLNKLKELPKLKVLKIVDVKTSMDDVNLIKASLGPNVRIIFTIREYMAVDL